MTSQTHVNSQRSQIFDGVRVVSWNFFAHNCPLEYGMRWRYINVERWGELHLVMHESIIRASPL